MVVTPMVQSLKNPLKKSKTTSILHSLTNQQMNTCIHPKKKIAEAEKKSYNFPFEVNCIFRFAVLRISKDPPI